MNCLLRHGLLLVALHATWACACAQENAGGDADLPSRQSKPAMNNGLCPVDSIWFADMLHAINALPARPSVERTHAMDYGLWVEPLGQPIATFVWMSYAQKIEFLEEALRSARELESTEQTMHLNLAKP